MSASPLSVSTTPVAPSRRSALVIGDDIHIPAWVDDLDSFRRWAWSDDFPQTGQFAYLQDIVWADVSMEDLFTHNQVKAAFALTLLTLLQKSSLGRHVLDNMLLTNAAAQLSTEPDGLFYTYETMRAGRLRRVETAEKNVMELEGSPDMVLEVVSKTSVQKDTVILRKLYWEAGIKEYWLVDARGDMELFQILRHTASGYTAIKPKNDWLASEVFGRSFRLRRETDPLGDPQFVVDVRSPEDK